MRIVLDTNILLVSISYDSKFRMLFDKLLSGSYELIISNDILLEYVEIITQKASPTIASNIAELLFSLNNVHYTNVYYNWNLIIEDPSDNKFIDAALSGGCDYIVTNDKHFRHVSQIEFPKIQILSLTEFMELLRDLLKLNSICVKTPMISVCLWSVISPTNHVLLFGITNPEQPGGKTVVHTFNKTLI